MTMPNFDLSGRTALVTGANTGLGQGIALALGAAGARIVAAGRSANTETRAMAHDLDIEISEVQLDLAKPDEVDALLPELADQGIDIDILVNNAGIIRRQDAVDFSAENWDDVMMVNLRSGFFLCQAFANRVMARGTPGKIINIASMLSYQGGIRVASYTASKSGVMGLTRLLANEWAPHGINVNAIAPGYFATNNTAALQADATRNRQILERIPAARWGKPSDLGGAAVFLASPASDYVHGITLPVDGGWLSR